MTRKRRPYLRVVPTPENLKERVWSRIEQHGPNDCWEWTGALTQAGYGTTLGMVHSPIVLAHRLIFTWFVQDIPEGMFVCHHCDNRRCVNPLHLFLGTAADNNWDRNVKGRRLYAEGEAHYNAALTNEQIRQIRASSLSQNQLARQFGVSQTTIWKILHRLTYTNV